MIATEQLWDLVAPNYGFMNALFAYAEYTRKYPKRKGASWETLSKRALWYAGGRKARSARKRYKALSKQHRQAEGRRARQRLQYAQDRCGTEVDDGT